MSPPSHTPRGAVFILGWCLVFAGLLVAGGIGLEVWRTLCTEQPQPFIARQQAAFTGALLFSQGNTPPVRIEAGGALLAATVCFCGLSLFGLSAGLGLLHAGVYVLSPQFRYALSRVSLRIGNVVSAVRELQLKVERRLHSL